MHKRIAALDLGTNSFHLLLARLDMAQQEVYLERRRREFVFLGRELEGSPPAFSDSGMQRAVEVLRSLVEEARQHGAEVFLACATEAFRLAQNAALLQETIRHELGLEVRILSGVEEARLIHLGVRHGLPLPEESYLVMDIGGGSVEFIWGQKGEILYLHSFPLGVSVLQRQFPEPDPLPPAQLQALHRYIRTTLEPLREAIKAVPVRYLIGTAGTFKTLGRLIAHSANGDSSEPALHGYRFSPMRFYPIYQKLTTLPLIERVRLKGMQAERAPYMPYGAALVYEVLQLFPIQTITISEYALREGLVYEYAGRLFSLPSLTAQPLRERTISALAQKYQLSLLHAQQTRRWAERLFDLLAPLHHLGKQEKEWLAYAAYLHDIGHFINPSGHHKHGLYLLLNTPMPGFTQEELLLMANLVRYHRKSLPSSEHFHYAALPRAQKKLVGFLAPLVRLADQLAKYLRHDPLGVRCSWNDKQVELIIDTTEASAARFLSSIYAEVEDFFERSYGRRLQLQLAWVPPSGGS
ncbi:MAG: Ppx/GppA family phosphatase [Bacteroidia bacterium]|nr:Ppx/GppA family phosphatase [Bacteroidia bacterium]MDW8089097.1 Ppx/GppA phosphatase family protein [Bacteroidia bacterium]